MILSRLVRNSLHLSFGQDPPLAIRWPPPLPPTDAHASFSAAERSTPLFQKTVSGSRRYLRRSFRTIDADGGLRRVADELHRDAAYHPGESQCRTVEPLD